MTDNPISSMREIHPNIITIDPLRADQPNQSCLDQASSADALISGYALLDTVMGPIYAVLKDIRLGDAGHVEISFTINNDHDLIAKVELVLADPPAIKLISHFDSAHLCQWLSGPDPCRSNLAILSRRRLLEHVVVSWVTELGQGIAHAFVQENEKTEQCEITLGSRWCCPYQETPIPFRGVL